MNQTLVERYNELPNVDTANKNFLSQLHAAFPDHTKPEEKVKKLLVELAKDHQWPSSTYTKLPLFGVWLIHRHYELEDGEKMVFTCREDENAGGAVMGTMQVIEHSSTNAKGWHKDVDGRLQGGIYGIMEPRAMTEDSFAYAMKWDRDGKELEHIARPLEVGGGVWEIEEASTQFDAVKERFDEVMKNYNITALGLCLGPTRFSLRYLEKGYVLRETTNQSELLLDRKHILNLESDPPDRQIATAWIPLPSIWDQSRDSPEDRDNPLHWSKLKKLGLRDTHPLLVNGCNHPCNPGEFHHLFELVYTFVEVHDIHRMRPLEYPSDDR